MAMFLCGLEESPYTSWTLSGMASCAHRLFLSGGGINDECNDVSKWTTNGGTNPTPALGLWKYTLANDLSDLYYTSPPSAANYDVRMQYEVEHSNDSSFLVQFGFAGSKVLNFFVYLTSSGTWRFTAVGSQMWTHSAPTDQRGTLRFTREGTVGTNETYNMYWRSDPAEAWTQIESSVSYTEIDSGNHLGNLATFRVYFYANDMTSSQYTYMDSIRNVVPTVTSGTATSPAYDTVDGLRGIGWFVDTTGTGTVAVNYRTSANGSTWTEYAAATAWAPIVPSATNRYVQVQVAITGGSTTAASPEIGPILINGSIDSTTSGTLFKRMYSSMLLHSDSSWNIGINQDPTTQYSWWCRAVHGMGRWLASIGNSSTWHGTALSIGTNLVGGLNQSITNISTLNPETTNFLPGVLVAHSILLPTSSQLISSAQKTAWTTAINADILTQQSNNWCAMTITNMLNLTGIHAVDSLVTSGQWTKTGTTVYADSDAASSWTDLSGAFIGDGAIVDWAGHYGDIYSLHVGGFLARALIAEPTYTNATACQTYIKSDLRYMSDFLCPNDGIIRFGRSQHAGSFGNNNEEAILNAEVLNAGWAIAREICTQFAWRLMRTQWIYGYDFINGWQNRLSNQTQLSGDLGVMDEMSTAMTVSSIGILATASSNFYTATPQGINTNMATAHPAWGAAAVFGPDSTYPRIMSDVLAYENAHSEQVSRYNNSRLMVERFALNTGVNSSNIPNQQGLGFYWNDSSLSSGNLCCLTDSASTGAYVCGLSASTRRSGTPRQFSATVFAGSVTGVSMSEVYWLHGRHAVIVGKLSMTSPDSRTISGYGYASPPMPLAQSATLANTATTTTTAYAEQPTAEQSNNVLSVFCRGCTSNLNGSGVPRTGTQFLTEATQGNLDWYGGQGVDLYQSTGTTLSSPLYTAADFAFGFGAMTAATEAARIGSWTLTGDVATFTFTNPDSTVENVALALAGQTWTNFTAGNYTITSSSSGGRVFTGESTGNYFGGSDLTLVKLSGSNYAALATAGNISVTKISSTVTRILSSGSDTTLYAGCLPSGFAQGQVLAYDWDGSTTDVTSSCTITGTTSVLIPSATVASYAYGGLAKFDIATSGTMASSALLMTDF